MIGVIEMAVLVIFSNMNEVTFSVGLGIQSAVATTIGNAIGKGNKLGVLR